MVEIRILLFGPPAMAVGADTITVSLPPQSRCGELKGAVAKQFPVLRGYAAIARFAVNGRYAEAALPVGPDDEIAMICMVSGG